MKIKLKALKIIKYFARWFTPSTNYKVNLGDFAPREMTDKWEGSPGARVSLKVDGVPQSFQMVCLAGTRGEGTFIRWMRME